MDLGSKEGTSKTNDPSSSSTTKLNSNIAIAQYNADAILFDEFEKAFLDGVKCKSYPWEIYEMNGIHSLQLIMRRSFQDTEHFGAKAMIHTQLKDSEIQGMDNLSSASCHMVRLTATATTPILGVDSAGLINGWNTKIAKLTRLAANDAMGKSLVNDLVYQQSRTVVENHISRALQGEEDKKVELKLRTFGVKQHNEQKLLLQTGEACERQLMTIIADMEFRSMEESHMKKLNNAPFLLGGVMDAILSQVITLIREKNLLLIHDISEEIQTLSIYGDQIRLQQVLSVFLQNVVHHAPTSGGCVEIKVTINSRLSEDGILLGHLEFRMAHPGEGAPSEVIQDMFEEGTRWATHEALG